MHDVPPKRCLTGEALLQRIPVTVSVPRLRVNEVLANARLYSTFPAMKAIYLSGQKEWTYRGGNYMETTRNLEGLHTQVLNVDEDNLEVFQSVLEGTLKSGDEGPQGGKQAH